MSNFTYIGDFTVLETKTGRGVVTEDIDGDEEVIYQTGSYGDAVKFALAMMEMDSAAT